MVTTTSAAAPAADHDEPPFAPALVEEVLRQLDKAVRARQLYLANNPMYQRALDTLRSSFGPLWKETDSVTFQVTDTAFKWSGVVVHEQPEKASDSLPWLFYKDGLREITLSRGFEIDEVDQLVDIIPRVRRAQPDEDDLITILWEHEFNCLTYRHVDLAHEGAAPLAPGAEPGRFPAPEGALVEPPTAASEQARSEAAANPETLVQRPGVVKLEDFDSTLYFLDEKEIEYVRQEIEREYAVDLRRAALDALLDIFELQTDAKVREEVLSLLDQLVLHMLSAARFATVAHLLRESAVAIDRARDLSPEHMARLKALPDRLSDAETLSQILQQLDEASELPAREDLTALFSELNAKALETVFDWLGRIQNARLRPLVEAAADRLAGANTTELVRIISHGSGPALLEAVRRAGALRTAAAVAPLAKLLGDENRDLRLAAVTALVEIASPGAMQTMERALADSDRDVRITAVRALGARGQRSALPKVESIVKSRELRNADLSERMAFFEAYGALCGDGGVAFLDGVLNGKSGLLGRKEDPELRACAAMALGQVKTERANAALQKALAEKDVVVRNAVNRALRNSSS